MSRRERTRRRQRAVRRAVISTIWGIVLCSLALIALPAMLSGNGFASTGTGPVRVTIASAGSRRGPPTGRMSRKPKLPPNRPKRRPQRRSVRRRHRPRRWAERSGRRRPPRPRRQSRRRRSRIPARKTRRRGKAPGNLPRCRRARPWTTDIRGRCVHRRLAHPGAEALFRAEGHYLALQRRTDGRDSIYGEVFGGGRTVFRGGRARSAEAGKGVYNAGAQRARLEERRHIH